MKNRSCLLFILLVLTPASVYAQTCKSDPATLNAAQVQRDMINRSLAEGKKACEDKLVSATSIAASQHSCACNNYTGDLTDRDIFESRFAAKIQQVKEQFKEQTGGDPAKEKKLVNDLYANYLRAKDNLPCGNAVGIFPNVSTGLSTNTGGFYCAANEADATTLKLPRCSDTAKAEASKAAMSKDLDGLYTLNHGDAGLAKQFVCDQKPVVGKDWSLISQDIPPCSLSFEKKFQDNGTSYQSGVTDQAVMKEIQSSECYTRIQKEGLEIDHIEIDASSSLLANTGAAANKTFKTLSDDRASKIENSVFKKIPGFENVKYTENTGGKNGDGTSGPCPYLFTKESPNWKRRPDVTDGELDKNQYVHAKIYYKNKASPVTGKGNRINLACSMVSFGCDKAHAFSANAFK